MLFTPCKYATYTMQVYCLFTKTNILSTKLETLMRWAEVVGRGSY